MQGNRGKACCLLLLVTTLSALALRRGARVRGAGGLGARLVDLIEERQGSVLEGIGLLLELSGGNLRLAGLSLGHQLAASGNLSLELGNLSLIELISKVLEMLLSLVEDTVKTVGTLNSGLALLVRLG